MPLVGSEPAVAVGVDPEFGPARGVRQPDQEAVTVEMVVSYLKKNAENACTVVRHTVAAMPKTRSCKCGSALEYAILTDRSKIPRETRRKLSLLLDKYLKTQEAGA